MKNFGILVGLTLMVCLVLTGCGGGGAGGGSGTTPTPTLSTVAVSSGSSTVNVGSTLQLTAKGTYSDGSTVTVTSQATWTSSDPSVATVTALGIVTGVKAGTATISAKLGTLTGTMVVTVMTSGGGTSLSSISVTAGSTSVATGGTLQLTAQGTYSDNTTQILTSQVTWQSSDPTVAAFNSSAGLLTALKAGTTTISATQGSVTGQLVVTVTQVTLSSIAIVPASFSIASGQTKQLSVQGNFTDGSSQDVTAQASWGSNASSFATVGTNGLVAGVAPGTATITATVGALNATATANVTAAVLSSITVKPSTASVPIGQTQPFTASGVFSDGSSTDMTNSVAWSSAAANVASVDQTGLATGVATGSATIRATSGAISGSATLTVTAATLTSIDIFPDAQPVQVGGQLPLTVFGTYSDNTAQSLTNGSWSSSDPTLATVDPSTGVVTGVKDSGGNAVTITVTAGGFTNTTTVYVTPAVIESIALSPATSSIAKGTTQQYTVNATFSDGSVEQLTQGLTWSTSAPSIASVNGTGLATGLGVGDATVTVSYETLTANADLTVTGATLSSIVVTPALPNVGVNGSIQLTATGVFTDNSTQDLTNVANWSSSTSTVALVNATGLATGLANGSATITASYSGLSGSTTLNVTSVSLTAITITPSNPIVPPHSRIQMTAIGTYSDGSQIPLTSGVTWYTNTGRYMNVSSTGVVRTKRSSASPVPVYARLNGVRGQTNITITTLNLQSLAVTPTAPTMAVGTKLPFQLIGTFQGGTTVDLTRSAQWQTSNYHFAVINNAGVASGIAPGSVTITGGYGGLTATAALTVSNATIQSIAVTPATASVVLGGMQPFTATGTFSDSSQQDITGVSTWTSSDPAVAIVNSTGLATSATSGQTNINATFKGTTGTAVLTVN